MTCVDKYSDCETEEDEQTDDQRTAIRAELSSLSFEELQKLKERIGAKMYKEAIFGTKTKAQDVKAKVFKRDNKNRPREMSSKKPVSMIRNIESGIQTVKKKEIRDPRFDPLCGEFDKREFSDNYKFLNNVRKQDITAIKAELKQTVDPEQEVKLRRLLQRLKDKAKSNKQKYLERERRQEQREVIQQELSDGKQHRFLNKSERRVEALVKQYEELKTEGPARIQRHLKRRQQKVKKRSHRAPTGVS